MTVKGALVIHLKGLELVPAQASDECLPWLGSLCRRFLHFRAAGATSAASVTAASAARGLKPLQGHVVGVRVKKN